MKKTYVTPDVEILDLTETKCHEEEILSSTGEVIGTRKVEVSMPNCMPTINYNNYYGGNYYGSSNKKHVNWGKFWPFWR